MLGRADDALRLLAPQATGNNAEALNDLCRVYFSLSDWDNAVRNCERAAQLEPANAIFQLWLGRSYGEKANVSANLSLTAYSLARKTVAAFITARSLDRHNIAIARDLAEYYAAAPAIVGGGGATKLWSWPPNSPPSIHPMPPGYVPSSLPMPTSRKRLNTNIVRPSASITTPPAPISILPATCAVGKSGIASSRRGAGHGSPHIRPVDHYDAAELLLNTNRNLPLAAQQMRSYIQGSHTEEEAPLFRAHFLLGEILLKSGDPTQAAAEYRAALALASSYRPAGRVSPPPGATLKPGQCARLRRNTTGP